MYQKKLTVGQALEKIFTIKPEDSAAHIGSGDLKVLATPVMIAYMEITARTLLQRSLAEGYSSVGSHVDVRHLAPSFIGAEVLVKALVAAVEGKKVQFEVSAWVDENQIGTGKHTRYVIHTDSFLKSHYG